MNLSMLLLVSAMSVLVVPAVATPAVLNPTNNLKHILDLAANYTNSFSKELFVDDVSPLVDGGCKNRFFCKVHDILKNRQDHFTSCKDLVRNLNVFIRHEKLNCEELLKDVSSTGVSIQIPKLMEYLASCIRERNFKGSSS